ncbi:hypothetical protein VME0621_05268 [Vibrio mediterranei]|uniref:Uncharacterized protein n=1 Tax=Vibrio mediterranei TaxID=689 RepID=A0A3G4V892_9VIBR|nr:hypothetical protein [Vibrio mediterranei]AYV19834.1 hypothetical protein ECB94_00355 [Vibrio mediterranei]AYV19842.1 hypothetical protein ECB94_00395 [Vibrio mediterranei]SBO13087.1 hypothetical protein VME0621_05268 [Vibrio mediterranei]
MAWIIKLKTSLNDSDWYVTKINRSKTDCQVTSDRYSAKLYKERYFFEEFLAHLKSEYEVIKIDNTDVHLYSN